nr:hypothetical protein [Acidisoma silvae]
MLSNAILNALWPQGDRKIPGLRAALVAAAPGVFIKYGLTRDLLVAHAMAQFSHECGGGTEIEENLNYSAAGLVATWPNRLRLRRLALLPIRLRKLRMRSMTAGSAICPAAMTAGLSAVAVDRRSLAARTTRNSARR